MACADDGRSRYRGKGRDAGADGFVAPLPDGARPLPDAAWNPDATCAIATTDAEVVVRPVDIIWMVDNSTSMEPAIRQVQNGLNDFASRIASSGLDYRVIMLSLRGRRASDRFPICIPPPLSGGSDCSDGERFFHVSMDVKSTQPIEQFLGTLAQTEGYTSATDKGSEPWRQYLREDSTKAIVVVTDDNQRTCDRPCRYTPPGVAGCTGSRLCSGADPIFSALALEEFPGGGDPFNSTILGPGILTDTYSDLFLGYTFSAIYGWGSTHDPDRTCTFPDGTEPIAPGWTYTELIERTGGARAQICDQSDSAAWSEFFGAIATTVEDTVRIECELEIPSPPDGMMLNESKVNVLFQSGAGTETIFRVRSAEECSAAGGWYYDDAAAPSHVVLCPSSCEGVQEAVRETGSAGIHVAFGCDSQFI